MSAAATSAAYSAIRKWIRWIALAKTKRCLAGGFCISASSLRKSAEALFAGSYRLRHIGALRGSGRFSCRRHVLESKLPLRRLFDRRKHRRANTRGGSEHCQGNRQDDCDFRARGRGRKSRPDTVPRRASRCTGKSSRDEKTGPITGGGYRR